MGAQDFKMSDIFFCASQFLSPINIRLQLRQLHFGSVKLAATVVYTKAAKGLTRYTLVKYAVNKVETLTPRFSLVMNTIHFSKRLLAICTLSTTIRSTFRE